MTTRNDNWQGMNWCRPATRLAIYLRDGMACVYCGKGAEDGVVLTLDHCKPYSKGGSNDPKNLVCACATCNSARGNRRQSEFIEATANYLGTNANEMKKFIRNTRNRVLPRKTANDLIKSRGTVAQIVKGKLY